jgi:A/G-specific adenine glycosylase
VLGRRARRRGDLPPVRHGFTHFDLDIHPALLELDATPDRVMDGGEWLWYNPRSPHEIGLPAVVARLLDPDADHVTLQNAGGSQ